MIRRDSMKIRVGIVVLVACIFIGTSVIGGIPIPQNNAGQTTHQESMTMSLEFPQPEMQETLIQLKRKIVAEERERSNRSELVNIAEGEAFLAANAEKEGVVQTQSGLQYRILEAGNDRRPGVSDEVTCRYRGTLVSGNVFDLSAVKRAVQGQEAAICTLGSNSLGKTTVRGEGTANIVRAMEEEHVDRLLVVSAMGTGESWSSLSFTNKLFYATILRRSRQDHEAQEAAVKESGLDWTIIRPSGLVNTPGTGEYSVGENIRAKTSQIPRADVADLILNELEERVLVHKAVTITN